MIFFTFVRNLEEVKVYSDAIDLSIYKPVLTIGVFDGLHRGHQQLIKLLQKKAEEVGGESVVLTFWPHPRMVLGKENSDFKLLTTLEEKEYLLEKWGVNHLIILPFNQEFAKMGGRDFIKDVLVGQIGMKHLVIGDDHRFGHDREGGQELLSEMGVEYGFSFTNLKSHIENDLRISSSLIRSALKSGNLQMANTLLGYPYFIFGNVIEGNQFGRKIGFPTANIDCCGENKQFLEDGVYVVKVDLNNKQFGGMLNIGTRPTVDNSMRKSIEVHIFDISSDLYGKKLKVSFLHRLRDEMKFNNTEELRAQLERDRKNALTLLGLPAFQENTKQ